LFVGASFSYNVKYAKREGLVFYILRKVLFSQDVFVSKRARTAYATATSYDVTPEDDEDGEKCFEGVISVDGVNSET